MSKSKLQTASNPSKINPKRNQSATQQKAFFCDDIKIYDVR